MQELVQGAGRRSYSGSSLSTSSLSSTQVSPTQRLSRWCVNLIMIDCIWQELTIYSSSSGCVSQVDASAKWMRWRVSIIDATSKHSAILSRTACTTMAMHLAMHLFRRCMRVWEAFQVELQGQYSLLRLRQLLEYQRDVSLARTILTIVVVPLPSVLCIVALESLPQNSPHLGIYKQSAAYWIRCLFTSFIMSMVVIMVMIEGAPRLSMTWRRLVFISAVISLVLAPSGIVWAEAIGFPTPFGLQLSTTPWILLMTLVLWISWKDALKSDPETRFHLQRTLDTSNIQVTIVQVYTVYNYLYYRFSSDAQILAALGLPVMKLVYKNWVSKSLFMYEDRAPLGIIMNVDVFHVFFVSSTMQQTTTLRSLAITVVVDIVQQLVAYYEVSRVLARVHRRVVAASQTSLRRGSTRELQHASVQYALHLLETNPRIRAHPEVALPRHLRVQHEAQKPGSRVSTSPALASVSPVPTSTVVPGVTPLTSIERTQLESAKSILKILHMVESYVLVEYIEVLGTCIYSIYLLAMTYLPNRAFNLQLAPLTQPQLFDTVVRLGVFAALEVASLLVFCFAIDRRLQHFSSLRLLGFVINRHAIGIALILILWVNYTTVVPLEHSGQDFTFQFTWLHRNQTSTPGQ